LVNDETVAPVLDPGRGCTKKGYFWALARDNRPWGSTDPPAIAYSYAPGRGAVHALKPRGVSSELSMHARGTLRSGICRHLQGAKIQEHSFKQRSKIARDRKRKRDERASFAWL
jgi:hypothetical protein